VDEFEMKGNKMTEDEEFERIQLEIERRNSVKKERAVVYYIGPLSIHEWALTDSISYIARLREVTGHPALGDCFDVRTSSIVEWPNEEGTFTTLNTIYKRYIGDSREQTNT
jgi:hypothetical protein